MEVPAVCTPKAQSRRAKRRDAEIWTAICQIALSTRHQKAGTTLFFVAKAAGWTVEDLRRIQTSMNASPMPHHPSAKHERKMENSMIDYAIEHLRRLMPYPSDDDEPATFSPEPSTVG